MDERDDAMLKTAAPDFDAQEALQRFRARAAREHVVPRTGPIETAVARLDAIAARLSLAPGGWLRAAGAAIGVVVIATALAMTGVADTILTIFEPRQVATVRVDPQELRGIPDPTEYGTLTWIARPSWHAVADANAAAAEAGFAPLVPSSLPAGVPAQGRFAVMGQAKATFQFDEAKARAAAAKVGATIPPMPAAIAATTLTMTGGPAILQQYGAAANGGWVSEPAGVLGSSVGPQLVIVQARAPVVTSNGATVDELRDYALAQPGIPASVAAQIRAIGDPVRTLMLPVGLDFSDAKAVTVRGTQGYFVGDQTGLGSGVIWLERGYVFVALGSLTETDLIALVSGLR